MKTRRHHNNHGLAQIKSGATQRWTERMRDKYIKESVMTYEDIQKVAEALTLFDASIKSNEYQDSIEELITSLDMIANFLGKDGSITSRVDSKALAIRLSSTVEIQVNDNVVMIYKTE